MSPPLPPPSTRDEAPVASVIVSVYQQHLTPRLALMSLMAQVDAPAFEVIFADDGSDASVAEACRDLVETAPFPVTWVWQQDRGNRLCVSRNNAIRLARGRILIYLDGDMVPEDDYVANHVTAHADGVKRIVVGRRRWRNLDLMAAAPHATIAEVMASLRGDAARDEANDLFEVNEHRLKKRRFGNGAGWCVAANCNLSVEKAPEVVFDEQFLGWGGEDSELAFRLTSHHGYEVIYDRQIKAYHLQAAVHNPLLKATPENLAGAIRNLVYFADKWPEAQETYGYYPLSRLALDPESDTWRHRSEPIDREERSALLESARAWLDRHGQRRAPVYQDTV